VSTSKFLFQLLNGIISGTENSKIKIPRRLASFSKGSIVKPVKTFGYVSAMKISLANTAPKSVFNVIEIGQLKAYSGFLILLI